MALLAMLALATPLPAMALNSVGGTVGATPAPLSIAVSTSLDGCGLIEGQIVCKLDVSFPQVPGATNYTAAVTRADGSVADYGALAPGGSSLWVHYVGPGTYSVRVSAYGALPQTDPGEGGGGNALATGTAPAKPSGDPGNATVLSNPGARGGKGGGANATETATDEAGAADAAETATVTSSCDQSAGSQQATPGGSPADRPPEDLDPNDADEDDDGIDDAEERAAYELTLSQQQQDALEAQGTLPSGVECATP